jgi:hypothetical protein
MKMGVDVTGSKTCREAIERAGLNWKTEKQSIEVSLPELSVAQNLEEAEAIVRLPDKKVLGFVDRHYHLFQNEDVFQFMDGIVVKGLAKLRRAGTFHDDKVIWLMLELPSQIFITGQGRKDHKIHRYFTVSATHALTNGVIFNPIPTRDDGLLMNFFPSSARFRLTQHIHDANEVRRGIGLFVNMTALYQEYGWHVEELSRTRISLNKFEDWARDLLPERQMQDVMKGFISEVFESSENDEFYDNTALAAMVAMCRVIDKLPTAKDKGAIWMGETRELKQQAFDKLLQILG